MYKDFYKKDPPEEMDRRRNEILTRLQQLKSEVLPLLQLFENKERIAQLKEAKLFTAQHLQTQFNIPPECIESLYVYAKAVYDCGIYNSAVEYLNHYRALSQNSERNYSALWGKFAAEILMHNWVQAQEDMSTLKEIIETKSFTPIQQLHHRTWLIHWSLFVFFNSDNGRNLMIDMLSEPKYLNAIQTTCPYILRYLTTAVITNRRRRLNISKDLVRVIQQEHYHYHDPITEFVECLEVYFDFEGAQKKTS